MTDIPKFSENNMVWNKPKANPSEAISAEIIIAGDWAPIRKFNRPAAETPALLYGDTLGFLQSSDFRIINLECPLSNRGNPIKKSGTVFKGENIHTGALKTVPFDMVTLANNHVFDYGLDAFSETLTNLNTAGILHAGAGLTRNEAEKPVICTVNNLKLAVFNFCEGEDMLTAGCMNNGCNGVNSAAGGSALLPPGDYGVHGWKSDAVAESIRKIKPQVSCVIAIVHCGPEYIPLPPPYVVHTLRKLADAGADAVIAHHPHVPQGVEIYNGVPIFYSLGNFIFYQETDLYYRKNGYMIKLRMNDDGVKRFEIFPYRINDNGISCLSTVERRDFFSQLYKVSEPLSDAARIRDGWLGFLHYYGKKGFISEVEKILSIMKTDPEKGAAMFRNRLTAAQHYTHWVDFLTQVISGTHAPENSWAYALVNEYFDKKI